MIFWSLIALIVFSIFNIFFNRPSTGTVVKSTLEDKPADLPESTNTITAKHFTLVYNSYLDTVSNVSASNPTAIEAYRIARSDMTGRRTFAITIKDLPMTEESSYRLRAINPNEYKRSTETISGLEYVLFEKTDGTEITGFTSRAGHLAMLSFTLSTQSGNLTEEASKLFANFSWLN